MRMSYADTFPIECQTTRLLQAAVRKLLMPFTWMMAAIVAAFWYLRLEEGEREQEAMDALLGLIAERFGEAE